MWSKSSTSNHTALGYVDCVLANALLAGPFVIVYIKAHQQAQQEGIQDGKS